MHSIHLVRAPLLQKLYYTTSSMHHFSPSDGSAFTAQAKMAEINIICFTKPKGGKLIRKLIVYSLHEWDILDSAG